MKLRYSATSPFVRKVLMVAHEAGLADRIELQPTDVWGSDAIRGDNPLGKVPALVTDDGTNFFDSPVICEYLDSLHNGPKLFPSGAARWVALKQQALGDGICDAAVARRIETAVRPEPYRWTGWVDRQRQAVAAALDVLEADAALLPATASIGGLAVAAGLSYLDLRFADDPWRTVHPKLAAWFAEARKRDSFERTEFKV
jgi:glutathione S-transferase